jgi:hypothetical protein
LVTCSLVNCRSTDKEVSDDTVDGTVDVVLAFLEILNHRFPLFVFLGARGANGHIFVDSIARFDSLVDFNELHLHLDGFIGSMSVLIITTLGRN